MPNEELNEPLQQDKKTLILRLQEVQSQSTIARSNENITSIYQTHVILTPEMSIQTRDVSFASFEIFILHFFPGKREQWLECPLYHIVPLHIY